MLIDLSTSSKQASMQEEHLRKGPWHKEEDEKLTSFVTLLGERKWDSLAKVSGLRRSGKSCRLRWMNYLRPNLKHGPFSFEEEKLIVQLQHELGNKWSKIAQRLPGRTDNEIKNYWRSHLRKKSHVQQEGISLKYESKNSVEDYSHKIIDYQMVKKENMCDTKDSSIANTFPSSDWELTSSPYETRIFDWILELQNQCDETEQEHDSNSNVTYGPEGFAESCCDTLDYSDSLWNLN